MIAFNKEGNETTWQSNFTAMLPDIEQKLHLAFCRLTPNEQLILSESALFLKRWIDDQSHALMS